MAEGKPDLQLRNLKRKRTTARALITKLSTEINDATGDTVIDYEYNSIRLQETLDNLTTLDSAIQDLLSDEEYETDAAKCEEYLDTAKRAILKAKRAIEDSLSSSVASLKLPPVTPVAPTPQPFTHTVKLPVIRLEPFSGDVEKWTRFWEQFQSSVDKNPSISSIDKHVFLRGYLEDEPKDLVDGIPITGDTYEDTKRILVSRYGDKNRIIQAHLDYLEALKPISHASPDALNSTYIECNRRIQALRALGEKVDEYGRMLAPKILRAFPEDIVRRWIVYSKREKIAESHITKLMEFLNDEVEGALTSYKIRGDCTFSSTFAPTAATLHVNTKSKQTDRKTKKGPSAFCVFCESRDHWAQDCSKVSDIKERIEKLRTANRCFLCLNRGHNIKVCPKKSKASCIKCKKSHHVSICNEEQVASISVGKIEVNKPNFTYLQTANIWITGPTGLRKRTRCILDPGSQSSFVSKSLVDQLQLTVVGNKDLTVTGFESSCRTSSARRLLEFNTCGVWTKATLRISAFESENVYTSHPPVPHEIQSLSCLRKLILADPKVDDNDLPIELLIGGDQYWKVILDGQPLRLSDSVVLIPSKFGWIMSGNKSGTIISNINVNHIHTDEEPSVVDDDMRRFWDLEILGIREHQTRTLTAKDAAILQGFHESFKIQDGRRVVSLPKKEDMFLSSNRNYAENRFRALQKKLASNAQFEDMYHSQMMDYIKSGHVEMIVTEESTNLVFYLPHHAVKKERNGTVKWRIVFDASSHERERPSLNDILEAGPNLLPEILSTLIRFRTYRQAIVGDGTQAFLQLCLDTNDRDLTRFFWYSVKKDKDGNWQAGDDVAIYRFTRLPFGLTSSPFLLSATLRELATRFKDRFPTAAALLDQSTFMDDFAAGAEDDNGVTNLYYELTGLLRQIRMPMAKWATNSGPLKDIWKAEGHEIKKETGVLGVRWDTESDSLLFDHRYITDSLPQDLGTKRNLLKTTSKFYDPLGLLSPVSIVGKILFQDTWCRGIEWDEILPHDIALRWQVWISNLTDLSSVIIPRWIGLSSLAPETSHVHVFCDASERAYGAALYVRISTDVTAFIHLVCSKNRLSPVKKVTLPRLELLAILVGSRLLRYFCQATDFDITKSTLWSDSMVALGWIKSDANRWKTFISNRVTEIQSILSPAQCRYCPSQDNPADLLSRGMSAKELQSSSLWWHGAPWLANHPDSWPHDSVSNTSLPETRKVHHQILTVVTWESPIEASKFSSYWKILHIMAWILRFLNNVRQSEKLHGNLTARELEVARFHWIRIVQRESFSEEYNALKEERDLSGKSKIARYSPFLQDGLIRLGGRLHHADLPMQQKHPLLLDGAHHFTKLLILQTHIRLHHLGVRIVLSALREEFWILRARQIIKKVLHRCLPCKISRKKRCEEIEAPLPLDRLRPTRPFAVTGIDFAGPLYVKSENTLKKVYIVLFTCAIVRAIHLEISTDLTTDRFLMAFQRFVGRRGVPHTIYTDNAQTFQAANRELQLSNVFSSPKTHEYMAHHNVTWKFIAPRAAWWGGWWERMIGSTKRCLRKVLGRSQIDLEGLRTVLISIEATLNSRPIVHDENTCDVLTPSHFLNGEKLTTIPVGPEPETNKDITKEFRRKVKMVEDFGRRWKREYLLQLRSYHEVKRPTGKHPRLRVGDVALLQEDVLPSHMWRRARVDEVLQGRDGRVRTAILRLPDGSRVSRPVQLVIPLEIDQGGEDVEN